MPTVLRIDGYRFGFFSGDAGEPPHVHVSRGRCAAKFWLGPVRFAQNAGFRPHDLREIADLIEENERLLLDAWNEYFG